MTDEHRVKGLYHVLLYYKFVDIADPEALAIQQRSICAKLELKGRILVAPEGINGTVSGTTDHCALYIENLRSDSRFAGIEIKVDEVPGHTFPKMFVRVKKELVTLRSSVPSQPSDVAGTYIEPDQWLEMLKKDDVIVLDGRTGFEYDIGHFRGAIRPPTTSFREFPEWIATEFADKKDKTIITYCTGGIRCEKLTSYMIDAGFKNVYQLHGGIVQYGKSEVTRGSMWDGLCYVFDDRIAVEINHTSDRRVVGRCYHCGTHTEEYVNCANLDCHRQHLSCNACTKRMQRSCSVECINAPRRELISE